MIPSLISYNDAKRYSASQAIQGDYLLLRHDQKERDVNRRQKELERQEAE